MTRDREFQRVKDTRMPERDAHGEDTLILPKQESDFDLRRNQATPEKSRSRKHKYARQEKTVSVATAPMAEDVHSVSHENGNSVPTESVEDHTPEPRHKMHQHGTAYQQKFHDTAKAEEQAAQAEQATAVNAEEPKRPSKLEFSADELPPETENRKLTHARKKANHTAEKLQQAETRLPARRKLRLDPIADFGTGKVKRRLYFETEVKSQKEHQKGPLPLRPVKAGGTATIGYAHKKVYQVEEENVGTKAAHHAELTAESGARMAYHQYKTAPYRKVSKLQKQSSRANANLAYREFLQQNPQVEKKPLSRMWQKQKIKRQYVKAAREARKNGTRAKDTAVTVKKTVAGMVRTVKNHPVICVVAILILLVVFMVTSVFSAFSSLGASGLSSLFASSYLAEDTDINQAELTYTEWETDLQLEIDRTERTHPGYDEYRYNIGAIDHDPYVLMGYLTAVYQDFTYSEIQSALRRLFNQQYSLTFTEEVEIRYRTEITIDPDTGDEIEEEVSYEYTILNVELTAKSMESIVASQMDADQREICELLLITKGNRQYVHNVFDTNWLPNVTSYYGYRVHPISGEKNYHTGVDIGMAQGTEILAGHDGKVTLAGEAGGYGLCVAIEGESSPGHTLTTKYGHCSEILVTVGQEVKTGDVIAKVGNTGNSTGPHLHLEVLVDGQYLNPLYFADTGDTSERTLSSAGSTGNFVSYDIPPEALEDEQFATMVQVAEQFLGYPYVWGGSSPSTSFDCSGFVSWVVNHSGWNVGRLSANGLLNVCVPVSRENAQPGDLIFFQGTYNTSGASHVGLYVGNNMMIHCGSPISYANITTSYWQQHFYTFGRLP